jgi:hypothetical protein
MMMLLVHTGKTKYILSDHLVWHVIFLFEECIIRSFATQRLTEEKNDTVKQLPVKNMRLLSNCSEVIRQTLQI